MGTNENRARSDRSKLRYPSDLTDDEWALVEPLIAPGKRGGGKRKVIMREVNGLLYILSTGCQWRAMPKDLPPKGPSTASSISGPFDLWTLRSLDPSISGPFDLWTYDGALDRIHHALYEQCGERRQREASPTAAIIDGRSGKSAEKGGARSIRPATMPARRSRARSAISWSARRVS